MPKGTDDGLFNLIKCLTKAEKRNFKLYANRLESNKDGLFIKLFDYLERTKRYSEENLLKNFNKLSKTDIANTKRHLYKQILKSLRLIHVNKDLDLQVREQLDNAKILYGKGLYLQALKLLDKIKSLAKSTEQEIMYLEVLEFQKLIESRHITRSRKIKNKVEDLISDSKASRQLISRTSKLSSLSIKIQGLYIKLGFVKNDKERFLVDAYYQSNKPEPLPKNAGFYEEVLLNQSLVWYHYMLMEFEQSLDFSIDWVDTFDRNEIMKEKDPDLYIRGMHYVLTNNFHLNKNEDFMAWLLRYEKFNKQYNNTFNSTTQILNFNYLNNARINSYLIQHQYTEGAKLALKIQDEIDGFQGKLDSHRSIMFLYKLAWLNVGCGNFDDALDYLNKILQNKKDHLRNDLIVYTKLLHLIVNYHLGNYTLVQNLSPGVRRAFELVNENTATIQAILAFLNKHPLETSLDESINKLIKKLKQTNSHPYEKRCFIYFNFIAWIHSLRMNTTMEIYYNEEVV